MFPVARAAFATRSDERAAEPAMAPSQGPATRDCAGEITVAVHGGSGQRRPVRRPAIDSATRCAARSMARARERGGRGCCRRRGRRRGVRFVVATNPPSPRGPIVSTARALRLAHEELARRRPTAAPALGRGVAQERPVGDGDVAEHERDRNEQRHHDHDDALLDHLHLHDRDGERGA